MGDGQPVEFDDLVRVRTAALLRVAYLQTGDRHAAEDLLQEVLEQMYTRWPLIHTAPEAYARRALVNRSTNRWRLRARRPEATLAHHDVAERDHSDTVVDRGAVLEALRELPPKQRAAVVLRYLEDLPVVEVARALDCSEGTVKSNAARGLERLRAAMAAVAIATVVAAATGIALARMPSTQPAAPGPSASGLPDPWADDQWRTGPFPLLTRPTRGDLADDTAYLRKVVAAWEAFDSNLPMVGEPNVVWAGTTPAGPAAFIAQAGSEGQINPDVYGHLGYVEPGPDGAPVIEDYHVLQEPWTTRRPPAMLLGARRDVLVVLDTGGAVDYAPTYGYADDGRITRDWQRVAFTDGAAVIEVPPQNDGFTLGLSGPAHTVDDAVEIGTVGSLKSPDGSSAAGIEHGVLPGGGDRAWLTDEDEIGKSLIEADAFGDAARGHSAAATTGWILWGNTPDGHRLTVETWQYGDDRRRVFYGLWNAGEHPKARYGGWTAARGPLEIRLRLPGAQGVVVAAAGATLRYRSGTGPWQDAEGDAALLPDSATEVRVARRGRAAVTVPLD